MTTPKTMKLTVHTDVNLDRKKMEYDIRNLGIIPKDAVIEFVEPKKDDGKVARSTRGGTAGEEKEGYAPSDS